MTHNDDSFATMLLMSQITPQREELVRPLSTGEWHALHAQVRGQGMAMGELMGMDMSGMMMRLGLSEGEAYRLCVLLGRVLPLSMCLERFAQQGIQVITWGQALYPVRLRQRLGDKAPPMVYVAGRPELFRQDAVAILGGKGGQGQEERVRALARMAVEKGYTIITDGAPGLSRAAQDEARRQGGRTLEVVSGGLAGRVEEADMAACLGDRSGAALALIHPDAPHTVSHALERNKCLYALAHAAFVFGVDQGRSAAYQGVCQALQRRWVDFLYAWDDPASPDSQVLLAKGATPMGEITPQAFDRMDRAWQGATARQMSLFDRDMPLA